jgi:hypothetical protein
MTFLCTNQKIMIFLKAMQCKILSTNNKFGNDLKKQTSFHARILLDDGVTH